MARERAVAHIGFNSLWHLHLEGTLGSEVGLEHFLEALGGVDVDAESGSLADNVGLGVNQLQRGHTFLSCYFV